MSPVKTRGPSNLSRQLKRVRASYSKALKLSTPPPALIQKFKARIKNIQHSMKIKLHRRENYILASLHSRSSRTLINSRVKCRSAIPHLSVGNELITSDSAKASIFSTEFLSNYNSTGPSSPSFSTTKTSSSPHTLPLMDLFPPWVIEQAISKIPPKCGFSVHLANYYVIKQCATTLALPLSIIFSESFKTSTVPKAWLHATIIPVFKKGNPSSPQNYRPISLTDPFARLFERIICRQIRLDVGHQFSVHQHGFLPRRSCPSSLVYSTSNYKRILKDHQTVDVVFFDFRKAFDQVNHTLLLQKLKGFGVPLQYVSWFQSFLKDRTFSVMVNGSIESIISPIPSGVPQGKVTGPPSFFNL
ncbi:hypothetical protein CRE_08137, partial [Caenorhabditis remanei]